MTKIDRQWKKSTSNERHKGSELHHQGAFLHDYYMFQSSHDGDHDGVVRLFVGLSCELGGFFNVIDYITLDYMEQFFYYQECNNSATKWVSAYLPIHMCTRVSYSSKIKYATKKMELERPK